MARREPMRHVPLVGAEAQQLRQAVDDWLSRQYGSPDKPFGTPTTLKHSDYSAKFGELVLCDASAAGFTVWLPAISASKIGAVVSVKDIGGSANLITVRPAGSGALIGDAAYVELSLLAGSSFVALTTTLWGQM